MEKESDAPRLTERFEEALVYAAQLHSKQMRKSSDIPYIAHLLAVAALVLENGAEEDEAIAALLHDAVEDAGGAATREEIRRRFGERVAAIVDGCTDTDVVPKPPWRPRKERHLERLRHAPPEVLRVSLADKLHNARAIIASLRSEGDAVWARFRGGKDGTLWYYRAAVQLFRATGFTAMTDELERLVAEMERLTGAE